MAHVQVHIIIFSILCHSSTWLWILVCVDDA